MDYTKNYHLPQWVKSDRIMMEDFNRMCADIEEGLSSNAQTAADAAQAAAQQPYVVGSYRGSGSEVININLGFKPSFVIITSPSNSNSFDLPLSFFCAFGQTAYAQMAVITENGFQINVQDVTLRYPRLNESPYTYQYIAFK